MYLSSSTTLQDRSSAMRQPSNESRHGNSNKNTVTCGKRTSFRFHDPCMLRYLNILALSQASPCLPNHFSIHLSSCISYHSLSLSNLSYYTQINRFSHFSFTIHPHTHSHHTSSSHSPPHSAYPPHPHYTDLDSSQALDPSHPAPHPPPDDAAQTFSRNSSPRPPRSAVQSAAASPPDCTAPADSGATPAPSAESAAPLPQDSPSRRR